MKVFLFSILAIHLVSLSLIANKFNPFLPPGQIQAKPPIVVNKSPTPTKPKPMNTNLAFRGYYKFQGGWKFAIFEKGKSEGFWVRVGESAHDGATLIKKFDPKSEELTMDDGVILKLEPTDGHSSTFANRPTNKGSLKTPPPLGQKQR